jgi:hypothetical protein
MRKIIIITILLVLIACRAFSACTVDGLSYTAASANYTDVKACTDLVDTNSAYGATVNIPAADGSATDWTTQITVTKNIRIVGAGIDVTKITSNIANASNLGMAVFNFVPDSTARANIQSLSSSGIFEVTGITFTGSLVHNLGAVGIYNTNLPVLTRVRIHHNKFVNFWAVLSGGNGAGTGTALHYANVLIDNNQVNGCTQIYYTGLAGANSFTNHRMYPGDGGGIYVEDNVMDVTGVADAEIVGGNSGGTAAVVRYNKFTGTPTGELTYIDAHSNQMTGISGGQHMEVYGNNLTATLAEGTSNRSAYIRGQKNIYLYNIFAGITNNGFNLIEEYNDHWSFDGVDTLTDDPLPLNMCASRTSANGAKQVCPGYTIGNPDSCICWKIHDTYFLNNRFSTSGSILPYGISADRFHLNNSIDNDPPELVENVEFFTHKTLATFQSNPNQGVTCGTAAQMSAITPSTAGVGFWIPSDISTMPCTSVSADNIKQTFGTNPVTPITGTLYKWNGSAWKAFWRPYTYPHPLRGESEADTTAPTASGCSFSGGVMVR